MPTALLKGLKCGLSASQVVAMLILDGFLEDKLIVNSLAISFLLLW